MGALHRWCRLTLVVLAAAAATFSAIDSGRSEGRAETGVPLELWKGHFSRGGKAFHYWDNEKEIPAVCARCHGANGVAEYLKEGKNTPTPQVKNAFACTNCHADMLTYERHKVSKVNFPSGLSIDSGSNDANLCMTCHQGRESTASVNKAIAGIGLDTPEPKLNFVHVHYFPAGAMLYGTEAKVGYEYEGKNYAGRFAHAPNVSVCLGCHQAHTGGLRVDRCGGCHEVKTAADLPNIRAQITRGDFDGNGKEEGVAREIANLQAQLYVAIQTYAKSVGGKSIAFTVEAHPYWYDDTNGNGRVDPEELRPANKYPAYTPRLMQAIYNFTFTQRDPGAAYHNGRYALQLLYDSLESLAASGKAGVDMKGKVRP